MKKTVLPLVAAFVCLAGVTAIRAISATTDSPIAVLLPANIDTRSLVQSGNKARRVPSQARTLTFAERVAYQRAIEEVYWRHRIWPRSRAENSDPKPSLDAVISQAQLEQKVKDYLSNSQALTDEWQRPITAEQLQIEMDRMAQNTRQPEVLDELFEALGNDPFVIAECLARPILAERLLAHPEFARVSQQGRTFNQTLAAGANYTLPTISDPSGGCVEDTWTRTSLTGAPEGRGSHTAVWTGSEMIVWGGYGCDGTCVLNTGGRYNPSTDSWTATSTTNAPEARYYHTAVWTGSEMIVWGGIDESGNYSNSGGRYNSTADSWTATSTTNAPEARYYHTAVWTGSEMIVWGGSGDTINFFFNSGGRYNPSTDSWTATSTANAPAPRNVHTAVWSGTQMIVWGGQVLNGNSNTGGRYNPSTDSWTATDTANAPEGREFPTAVWTGSEMIVWGGESANSVLLDTGGRYNPSTNSWVATSIGNAPDAREGHTAVWTGSNMIVWGGIGNAPFNSGGRYYPDIDLWVTTSTANAPVARSGHTAIWTGSEMVVWGGGSNNGVLNTGGRYCVPSAIPTPTPAPTPCPGGYAVCNGNDTGIGSLRQAIFNASSGDTITFAPSVTVVNLTSGELVIDKNLTITGTGANHLTVQVDSSLISARVFNIRSSTAIVSISGMTISNGNTPDDPGAGGILSAGILTLTGCTISDNSAGTIYGFTEGGGVMNDHGTMTITDCTISDNYVEGIGGGVLNKNGTMTITRCTISNNTADQEGYYASEVSKGGGILNDSGGSLVITNSTISGNTSSAANIDAFGFPGFAYGGGVDNSGSTTITNCTISGNSAVGIASWNTTGYGGGISNDRNLQIRSSTIVHNSATGGSGAFGGGVYGAGLLESTGTDSSIIAFNNASTGPDFTGDELESDGYNIIGNNADAVINSQPTDQIGTPTTPINPHLGPLADNGGPTLTHALQSGSVAINRGDPAAPPQDQRGYGRVGVADVGAFEFNGIPPTPTPTPTPTPPIVLPRLGNISTRAFVQTGDNVMIGGFIVEGTQPKRVIIRAIGPELTQYGVPNSLANPTLELHDRTGALIGSNDNWHTTIIGGIITSNQFRDIIASGHAPRDPRESAIIADLRPGNYTAIVRGVNDTTGVALVEVYDLTNATGSFLGNISTRSFVQTDDNVMIGGFIVQGTQPKRVILRAIGPELAAPPFNIPDALADPALELHDGTGALIASNNNWVQTIIGGIITANQVRDIRNSGHAPTNPRESAIIATLPPGNYTAIVRGVNNTTGVALVEAYDLD